MRWFAERTGRYRFGFSFGESIHITSNQKDINEISVKEYLNNKGHQGILVEKLMQVLKTYSWN